MDMLVTCLFLLEILTLMLCAVSIRAGLTCDHTKQNPVRNDTSMAIVGCFNCRDCPPGYEPKVPCGEIIGIHERVGGCRRCPDGMYSPKRDIMPCKICRKRKCFKHQQIEGKCERDKHDLSYCLNKCEKGYIMNGRKTACHLMNMTTMASVGSNIPKATPTITSINTTKKLVVSPNEANEKSGGLSSYLIAIIVIGIVAAVGTAAVALYCYCFRKQNRGSLEDKNDGGGSASTDVLVDVSPKQSVKSATGPFSNDLPVVERPNKGTDERANGLSSVPPCPETMLEVESSKLLSLDNIMSPDTSHPDPSISCISNGRSIPRITPLLRNDEVAFYTHVCSRTDVPPGPIQGRSDNATEQLPQPIISERLGGTFPYKILYMICVCFDTGPLGKNWRNLASWLDLSVQEFKCIENQQFESRTEQIIQIWATKQENNFNKFVQILKTYHMTQLIAEINEEMTSCKH